MLDHTVAEVLEEVARSLGESPDVDQILMTIVEAACLSIPEIDHAGISVTHRHGGIETRAATGDLVRALDRAQYEVGQGPCLDAMDPGEHQDVVAVDSIRHDQRWPDYVPRAVQLGLRSQLGVRVYAEARTVGGLNLYSTTSDTITQDSIAMAHLFAANAAVALGRVRRESHLLEALRTRDLIGQATGVVMERYGLDANRAFGYLTRVSQTSNMKLRDVAAGLVAHGAGNGSTAIDAAATSLPAPRARPKRASSPDSVG